MQTFVSLVSKIIVEPDFKANVVYSDTKNEMSAFGDT